MYPQKIANAKEVLTLIHRAIGLRPTFFSAIGMAVCVAPRDGDRARVADVLLHGGVQHAEQGDGRPHQRRPRRLRRLLRRRRLHPWCAGDERGAVLQFVVLNCIPLC